jgi:hypothetical protein
MNHMVILFLALAVGAQAGGLKADYYAGTAPGAWSQHTMTTKDGSVATYTYERKPDADGQAVLELRMKTTAGPGAGSESTMTYTLPKGFDLAKNGIAYGKYVEKMVMKYGEMEMPVDAATLETIRKAEKDYRSAVTFAGTEKIGDLECDRYTYAITSDATRDTGTLWLCAAVPFAVVKHTGRVVMADGKVASDFEIVLADRGRMQPVAAEVAATPESAPAAAPAPLDVTLADGFKTGRIGIEVQALNRGRQLSLRFQSKYDGQLTVVVPEGAVNLKVDSPVNTLSVAVPAAERFVLEPGASSFPIVVDQRGARGIVEGKCELSVYEGTPLFTGSVTMDKLPK